MSVPGDFPDQGVHPAEVVAARHAACLCCVEQLAQYCVRKEVERTRTALAQRLKVFGVHPTKTQQWDVSRAELEWCKAQVIEMLSMHGRGKEEGAQT